MRDIGDIILVDKCLKCRFYWLAGTYEKNIFETVVFNIKPFPSFLVIISISLVGFIGLSLLIHAMRQKKGKEG